MYIGGFHLKALPDEGIFGGKPIEINSALYSIQQRIKGKNQHFVLYIHTVYDEYSIWRIDLF